MRWGWTLRAVALYLPAVVLDLRAAALDMLSYDEKHHIGGAGARSY
jgi:hypothetical protein